jgi:hypothetical protein
MIPTDIHSSWYEAYWYGVPEIRRQYWRGEPPRPLTRHHRIDPALLAAGLFFAALAVGTALLVLFGPAVPADGLYFVT